MFAIFLMLVTITTALNAQDDRARLKEYLNDAANDVYTTEDPQEKREILDNMFNDLQKVFDTAENWPLFSDEEKNTAKDFKIRIKEKQDELNGNNGFQRVADKDLNSFASYTVHDFEQAAEYVTISVAALIIILLVILLL